MNVEEWVFIKITFIEEWKENFNKMNHYKEFKFKVYPNVTYDIYNFFVCVFETGFLCVALEPVLELLL